MQRTGQTDERHHWIRRLMVCGAAVGLITGTAAAQVEYEDLDDIEWERGEGYHEEEWYDPSDWFDFDEGVEYEQDDWWGPNDTNWDRDDAYTYDFDDIEWEQGEGYHEEEWYDPSDWFDADAGVEYETDDWNWGYDNNYEYWTTDDGWNDWYDADYDAYSQNYGWNTYDDGLYEDDTDWEYEVGEGYHEEEWYDPSDWFDDEYDNRGITSNQDAYDRNRRATGDGVGRQMTIAGSSLNGEVIGLERVRPRQGEPASVRLRLRTDDGQVRTLHLGNLATFRENRLLVEPGERIRILGQQTRANGRTLFKADRVVSARGEYDLNRSQNQRIIEGRLTGVETVRSRNGEVQALVAQFKTRDGQDRQVLLGSLSDLRRGGVKLSPGAKVEVEGYRRNVDGRQFFVVEDVRVDERSTRGSDSQEQRMNAERQREQQRRMQEERRRQQEQMNRQRGSRQGDAQQRRQSQSDTRTVEVVARNMEFHPSTIYVRPGQRVELMLRNDGSLPHNIDIELPNKEVTLDSRVTSGQTRTVTFQAPRQTGHYTFYCPVGDHRSQGMTGTLIVTENRPNPRER